MKKKYCKIEKLIKLAKKGETFILVDDESRENEGDLVFLANKCTPKKINFMAKFGRGLICLALDKKQSDRLGLKLMSNSNGTRFSTAFTVSIEAKRASQLVFLLLIDQKQLQQQLKNLQQKKIL